MFITMNLTDEQRLALIEFKARNENVVIPEHLQDDTEMVKWLIARKFNVDKATIMLRKSMEWRRKWNIDQISDWKVPEVLKKFCPAGMSGYTKEGLPVWITNSGKGDIRGLLSSVSKKDYLRYNVQILEEGCRRLNQQTKGRRSNPIFRQCLIIDLEDYTLDHATWKPGLDVTRELAIMYEDNYPEMLRTSYIINAPKVFTILYTALKPLLDQATLDKAKIFGTTGWQEALLEDIPADQLPVQYGGTMTDPDGNTFCLSKICYGGPVPESYYKRKIPKGIDLPPGYEMLVLASREKKTLNMEVHEPNTVLSWIIETENFDVGFGISYVGQDEEKIVYEEERINSQLVPEENHIVCTRPGTYAITFNNEFSYFRSKTIYHKITLEDLREKYQS